MLIAFLPCDCLEQWCRWLTHETRQRQCPSHGKLDSRRKSSAIPRLGMSSQSQSSAYRQEKIKAFNRIHQSIKVEVAPIQEWSHQHHSSNIVLIWSHSLNWDGILSQTKGVGINLHGTSSSGFPKSRTTSRASSLDCCRLCIYYGACCLGSSQCLLSTWISNLLLKKSAEAFRGTSLKCLNIQINPRIIQ